MKHNEYKVAWGIYFEEGVHRTAISLIIVVISVFSLVFGAVWSVTKGDVGDGAAVSACCCGFGSMFLAYVLLVGV